MEVEQLWANRPTLLWEDRMNEGDDIYTVEIIFAVDAALRRYVTALTHAGETEVSILAAVRDVVLRLNELDEEHDHFIETIEREELYDFIQAGVALAGYETTEDVTEEWREW
ncbi:hypothetical protein [Exiguobacterium aurantiacum]|uniref:Uncharacterized protein n=1 Tax=Exiguobacterium aurantiacum TaxID=33987 RepID=A0ABY5FNU3_9BACL|nr:hypothetical protein [Exiguobacterium aurantiacum]UTT43226.1 hypothetical protein NMQ00_01625 [Exiguobacterium aurantiacum]